jgi:ribosomal protein S27AE
MLHRCTNCGGLKEVGEFYADGRRPDGLQSECKQCVRDRTARNRAAKTPEERRDTGREAARKYRARHPERTDEYQRQYRAKNRDIYRKSAKGTYERNAEVARSEARRRAAESPEAVAARRKVRDAVKRGDLVRPERCPKCGRKCVVQAHHPDYGRPLDIEWLCASCHKLYHLTSDQL